MKIELGCRPAYLRELNKRTGKCPLGKWDILWQNPGDEPDQRHDLLVITVATGDQFQPLVRVVGPVFERYAASVGADFVQLTNTTQRWWGLEKFRVWKYAKQYDRTLFLDADVILTSKTPNLFDEFPAGRVAMHDDWPYLSSLDWLYSERRTVLESQGLEMDETRHALNSGVVMCDRDHADVWKPPERSFPTSHCAEQFWVEHNARQFPLFEIPPELNWQYWMIEFYSRLPSAKLIHLANCNNVQRVTMATQMTQW